MTSSPLLPDHLTDQPPTPDWHWHLSTPPPELHALDTLRTDHPILWAMCVGHRTSPTIASALSFPLDVTRHELRAYKRQGLIYDEQAPTSIVWRLLDDHLTHLRIFVNGQRRRNAALDAHDGSS